MIKIYDEYRDSLPDASADAGSFFFFAKDWGN